MHRDDVILQLGATHPLKAISEAAEAARAMGDRAADLLRANRTVALASRRLSGLGSSDDAFSRRFEVHRERLALRGRMIETSVDVVADLAREASVPVYGMKGLAMAHLYTEPGDRDIRDVDLWVATVDEAGRLARELLRNGFTHDPNELPWVKRADGSTYGQIRVRPDDESRAPVDIHFGPYSVGHRGRFPLTSEGAQPGGRLPRLALNVNLRATLGNATGDCLVTTKDLNDYWLALPLLDDEQWSEHVHMASRVGALRMLRTILHRLRATQAESEVVVRRDQALARRGILPHRLARLPKSAYRARATVRRSMAQAHRTAEGGRLTSAVSAWAYYRQPLRLNITDTRPVPLASAAADRCLRLVPVELLSTLQRQHPQEGNPGLIVVDTPDGELCQFAGVLYVPTLDYRVDRRLADQLMRRAGTNEC